METTVNTKFMETFGLEKRLNTILFMGVVAALYVAAAYYVFDPLESLHIGTELESAAASGLGAAVIVAIMHTFISTNPKANRKLSI